MSPRAPDTLSVRRLRWLYLALGIAGVVIGLRLGYLQVVQHSLYMGLATGEHQRKNEVPANRGQIYLLDGSTKVPLALDESLKLLYADPSLIQDKAATAQKLAAATGDSAATYLSDFDKGGEYQVLKG